MPNPIRSNIRWKTFPAKPNRTVQPDQSASDQPKVLRVPNLSSTTPAGNCISMYSQPNAEKIKPSIAGEIVDHNANEEKKNDKEPDVRSCRRRGGRFRVIRAR
jgi:hypothetical protein